MFSLLKAGGSAILKHNLRCASGMYQTRLYTNGIILDGSAIQNQTATTTTPLVSYVPQLKNLGSAVANSLEQMVSQSWNDFQDGIFLMSSTLKKRRAKMNKHKLKKRRKKLRLKSK
mmetsp:Transcript_13022/g.18434  ORF Transcript_13022/g.18434 Transcript_13022/m.18434 type:complete len:116 (-) Transcript_13022:1399-1746(-)